MLLNGWQYSTYAPLLPIIKEKGISSSFHFFSVEVIPFEFEVELYELYGVFYEEWLEVLG